MVTFFAVNKSDPLGHKLSVRRATSVAQNLCPWPVMLTIPCHYHRSPLSGDDNAIHIVNGEEDTYRPLLIIIPGC